MLRNTISIPGPLPRRTHKRFHPEQLLEATPHSPSASHQQNSGKSRLYLYSDERRDIRWNIAWARGQNPRNFWGLRLYFTLYPDSSHNTVILNYNSSITLPGRAILKELILHIALASGALFSSIFLALLGVYSENIAPALLGIYIYSTLPVELDDYWKILPCWLNNAGGLSFNIIMFNNWKLTGPLGTDRQTHQGFIDWTSIVQGYTIMGKK